MIKPLLLTVFSSLALAFLAQRPAGGELDDILGQAAKGRQAYIDGFKDLTTIETRVTELLDKNGRTEQQQTVVSDFLIYQSRFKNDVASEYRITREINGKAARHPTDEALKFWARQPPSRISSCSVTPQDAFQVQRAPKEAHFKSVKTARRRGQSPAILLHALIKVLFGNVATNPSISSDKWQPQTGVPGPPVPTLKRGYV